MSILESQTELDAITEQIQDLVGAITGIRSSPDDPPDKVGNLPAAITYPAKGRYNIVNKVDIKDSFHDIVIELHFSRNSVPLAVKECKKHVRTVPNAIAANQAIAALCEGWDRIDYELLPMKYGTDETFGVRFTIVNLKLYPYGVKDNPIF